MKPLYSLGSEIGLINEIMKVHVIIIAWPLATIVRWSYYQSC